MTEPAGAARSRSRPVRLLRRLRRRRSSGSFFILSDRRRAGPGDLARDALLGGLPGAAPAGRGRAQARTRARTRTPGPGRAGPARLCSPAWAAPSGGAAGVSGARGRGSSSGMGLYQIAPAGSPLPGARGPRAASSGGLAPLSTQRRLLGSRLCKYAPRAGLRAGSGLGVSSGAGASGSGALGSGGWAGRPGRGRGAARGHGSPSPGFTPGPLPWGPAPPTLCATRLSGLAGPLGHGPLPVCVVPGLARRL